MHTVWLDQAWKKAVEKVKRTSSRIGATVPHAAREGQYDATPADAWTSGFWPGMLWLIYEDTKNENLTNLRRLLFCGRAMQIAGRSRFILMAVKGLT